MFKIYIYIYILNYHLHFDIYFSVFSRHCLCLFVFLLMILSLSVVQTLWKRALSKKRAYLSTHFSLPLSQLVHHQSFCHMCIVHWKTLQNISIRKYNVSRIQTCVIQSHTVVLIKVNEGGEEIVHETENTEGRVWEAQS